MAQFFSALFFSLACMAAIAMIAAMLRRDGSRVISILAGADLERARAAAPRIKVRTWNRLEPRRASPPLRVAAA